MARAAEFLFQMHVDRLDSKNLKSGLKSKNTQTCKFRIVEEPIKFNPSRNWFCIYYELATDSKGKEILKKYNLSQKKPICTHRRLDKQQKPVVKYRKDGYLAWYIVYNKSREEYTEADYLWESNEKGLIKVVKIQVDPQLQNIRSATIEVRHGPPKKKIDDMAIKHQLACDPFVN